MYPTVKKFNDQCVMPDYAESFPAKINAAKLDYWQCCFFQDAWLVEK